MTNASPPPTCSSSSYSFEEFLCGWRHRLEQLSAEIGAVVEGKNGQIEEFEARQLIARTLRHFEEYYEHNSRAAHLNEFSLFSPAWCSSFETAFLWIAGFRPSVLLHLVTDSVQDLSPHQLQALDRLKRETRINEKVVEDELARIQETAAAPPLIYVIREAVWLTEGESFRTREPIEQLKTALEAVIANADCLRVTTGAKVAEILRPTQCLRFLVAAMRLLRGMRSTGMQRDNLAGERLST